MWRCLCVPQMAHMLAPASRSSGVTLALTVAISALTMSLPSQTPFQGLCAARSLTALGKAGLEACLPLVIGGMMLVLMAGTSCWHAAVRSRKDGAPTPSHSNANTGQSLQTPLLPAYDALGASDDEYDEDDAGATMKSTLQSALLGARVTDDDEMSDHYVDDATRLSLRARYLCAGVLLALLAYGTVSSTTVSLLHCVSVSGVEGRVLYVQGTQRCAYGGWQLGIVLLLAVLCAAPLLLVLAAKRVMQMAAGSRLQLDVHLAFKRMLVGSYVPRWHWWEAVLLSQRLLLSLMYTFGSGTPLLRLCLSLLVTVVFGAAHVMLRPMRSPISQSYQTLLMLCLVVVGLCNVPAAAQVQYAVSTGDVSPLVDGVVLVVGYVIPIAVVVCVSARHTAGALLGRCTALGRRQEQQGQRGASGREVSMRRTG